MTETEQWARELLDAVFDASDLGSACGIVDCPQCANAALTLQRAFEERERDLREALRGLLGEVCLWSDGPEILESDAARKAKALATRQPTPTEGGSDDQ